MSIFTNDPEDMVDAGQAQRMNDILDALYRSRVLKGALVLLILCFSLLRFINLNADFPSGITTSGVLYTDEGWLSAAAVRHALTGQWYQAGELNFAVTMPMGQILHRVSFALFGPSLASARITIAVSFISLTLLTALLVRRSFGDYAALLAALLLTTNYIAFAYSRLATMDLVATNFIAASLFAAGGLKSKGNLPGLLVASVLLAAGILTKTYAVMAVPLLAYLAWRSGLNYKERVLFVTVSMIVVLIFAGGYLIAARSLFPAEYDALVKATSIGFYTNLYDWLRHVPHAVLQIQRLGIGYVSLALVFTGFAFLVSRRFRRDPLVFILLGYIAVYLSLLSLNGYRPVRYNLPLLVPLAGLGAIACATLTNWLRERRGPAAAMLPILLAAAVSLQGSWQIINYLSKPSFSFYQMTHEVGAIIQEREGRLQGVLLYGDIADSVTLEIGTKAADSLLYGDPAKEIREYQPKYMIVHTSNIVEIAASEGGEVTELGAWDVFGNYYADHQPVRLVLVDWPAERKIP